MVDNKKRCPSVMLQYMTLIHYRESVFLELAEDPRIDFSICCGRDSPYRGMKNFDPKPPLKVHFIKNLVVRIGERHFFLWQWGALWNLVRKRPDIVILLGVDPHIVSTLPLLLLAKLTRTKIFWWTHATFGRQGWLGRVLRMFCYRQAHGILAYADEGRDRLILSGIPSNQVHTIWNCINKDEYHLVAENAKKNNNSASLLYIGRIYKDKKMHLLIEAAEILSDRVSNLRIDIVGDGPNRNALEKDVANRGLDRVVIFHGEQYGSQLAKFLAGADVGVVPSWAGLSVIQYMASGLPVVTERPNGYNHPPEVSAVIDGKTGTFFEFEDAVSLAKAIESTLEKSEEMSEHCFHLARNRFSPVAVKNAIIESIIATLELDNSTQS